MRTRKFLSAFVLLFLFLPVAIAQSITGNWTTIDDKTGQKRAVVNLVVKNGVLSGTVVKVYPQPGDTGFCINCPGRFKDKPMIGMEFVWGLKEKRPNSWYGGQIIDGKTGKIYRVKMALKGNKLYVRGYVGLSMMGRTQVWLRSS